ncbi:MAG: hypothetical protein II649_06980 [Kiritimatiellae bacterium]|nr:hypothetical protein [Kiritimatiellia bacterium]
MAYERKTKSAAELSAARSRAAKSRKHNRGGRPAGSRTNPELKAVPTRSLTVREPDYLVFRAYAFKSNIQIAEAMHRLARSLLKNHADLKPESWVE